MPMLPLEDEYQKKLANSNKEILLLPNIADNPPTILLTHFIVGSQENFLSFRRSCVWINESSNICDFAKEIINANSDEEFLKLHKQVHNNFVSYIDRDNTFLDLVIKNVRKTENNHIKESYWRYKFGSNSVNLEPNLIYIDSKLIYEINISEGLVNSLCSRKASNSFIKELYEYHKVSRLPTDWHQYFKLKRCQSLNLLVETNKNEEDRIDQYCNQINSHLATMGSIQSALCYLGAICKFDVEDSLLSFVVDVIFTPLSENKDTQSMKYCVTMVVTPATELADSLKLDEREISKIHEQNNPISSDNNIPDIRPYSLNYLTFHSLTQQQKDNIKDFETKIESVFHGLGKNSNTIFCAEWCLMILERIMGEVHESKKLDFFFICGEFSEFSDKTILRIPEFLNELEKLKIPSNAGNEFGDILVSVSNIIAKEHYHWFNEGRHALFWDISGNSGIPVGMVKLKEGSWKQIVNDIASNRDLTIRVPKCLFFYSLGNEDCSGLVYIESFESIYTKKAKFDPILYWDRDRWVLEKNEKKKNIDDIKKVVLELMPESIKNNKPSPPSWLDYLSFLIYRLSLDKLKGGTIIILKPNKSIVDVKSKFMGNSLQFHSTGKKEDDLIDRANLIAHDGASTCTLPHDKSDRLEWSHRGYILPTMAQQNKFSSIFPTLEHIRHPLSLKGTRRWAGAVAALDDAVQMSIVISQDGDIQFWHIKDCEGDAPKFLFYEIPRKGEPFQWDFNKNSRSEINFLSANNRRN